MKYYVASRSNNRKEAKRVAEALEDDGNEITFAWFEADGKLKKPYRNATNPQVESHARKAVLGAAAAERFVLISEPGMRGTYIEMGAYLGARVTSSQPVEFYLIGLNEEEHIFESFKGSKFYETVDEFIRELNSL